MVATRPASKQLADGRNANLCQWPAERWLSCILPHFDLNYMAGHLPEFKDRGLKERVARWALSDVRMAVPRAGEVVLLLSAKTHPN